MNPSQIIVTAIASVMIAAPLFLLAFLAGRRSVVTGGSPQIDRLRPDILLRTGTWEFQWEDESGSVQHIVMDLQQAGGRIVASGRAADGTNYSLEGILQQRRFCGICIDERHSEVGLATITADLLPGDDTIEGMRARWSAQSQTLALRKASLTRRLP